MWDRCGKVKHREMWPTWLLPSEHAGEDPRALAQVGVRLPQLRIGGGERDESRQQHIFFTFTKSTYACPKEFLEPFCPLTIPTEPPGVKAHA